MEALAHLLSLPTLHDDRKVAIGPLCQVFHRIMCLGLHHRDTVDLDASLFALAPISRAHRSDPFATPSVMK